MTTEVASIDSLHEDMVHDCQFDYYSKKLATCSSDRTIKVFDVTGDIYHCSATLTVHEGPVWQVAWAHPKFGTLLASCSYDGSVVIQKEGSSSQSAVSGNNSNNSGWSKVYEQKFSDVSVNAICWSPHEYGLLLACASSDGRVTVIEYRNGQW
jgi:protein transport protein SEC13